jgi:hypothetical protein
MIVTHAGYEAQSFVTCCERFLQCQQQTVLDSTKPLHVSEIISLLEWMETNSIGTPMTHDRSTVQHTHWISYTYEASQAN